MIAAMDAVPEAVEPAVRAWWERKQGQLLGGCLLLSPPPALSSHSRLWSEEPVECPRGNNKAGISRSISRSNNSALNSKK